MNKAKILFISHEPFSTVGNNGRTFLSLFKDFEVEDIAQLYSERLAPTQTKFNNFFRITDFNILKYKCSFNMYKIEGKVQSNPLYQIKPRRNSRIIFKSFSLDPAIKFVRNFLFYQFNITKIDSFKQWMSDFKPTVIFFVGSGYVYNYQILKDIAKEYKIPYYIYFTDDYFKYNEGTNWLANVLHKRFVAKSKEVVDGAKELFVIGPKMKREYEQYFNKKCTILINAVDKEEISDAKTNLTNPIVFRYFGWLHSNRSSSLGYLGQCLKYINDNFNKDCVLEIYSLSLLTEKSTEDLSVDTIKICDPLMGDKFIEALEASDFLVHAESFEPKDTQVTMLSVSTKIPEYLLSNRCIVAVGPSNLSSISLLSENNLAVILSEKKSIETDACAILKVIEDINIYNDYCQRGIFYCRQELNSSKMRIELKNILSQNHE